MANSFSISTPSNSVLLGSSLQGRAVFTVSNISGRINRGRARIVPQNTVAAPWLTLEGDAERDFPIASTHQFSVNVAVPPKSPPGSYVFQLEMVGVENPDEDLTQGPGVTFEMPVAAPTQFPWWILIAAGVLLLVIIGVLIAVLSPKTVTVPDIAGATQTAAERQLEKEGFKLGGVTTMPSGMIPKDLVLGTDPPAGSKVDPGTGIILILSSGPVATATPTATSTPQITNTWTPSSTAIFTPTFTASATHTFTPSVTPSATRTRTPTASPTPPAVIAHYPLLSNANEATNLTPPMTLTNAPFVAGGVKCNGIYEGNPGFCKITTPQLTGFNFNQFSIAARFNAAEKRTMPVFIGGRSYRWIGFYLLANGHVALKYNNSNTLDCGLTYAPGTWYVATVTYNGTTAKLYLNNTLACTKSFSISQGGDSDIGVTDFSTGVVYKGNFSDLWIYRTVITP